MVLCLRILARAFSHQHEDLVAEHDPPNWSCAWCLSLRGCHSPLKAGYSTCCLITRHENIPWKPSQFLTQFTQQLSSLKWSLLWDMLLFSMHVSSLSNISFCSLKITLKQSFQNDRVLKLQIQCSNSSECGEKFKPIYWFPFWFKYIQNKWPKFIRNCHSAKECCSNMLLGPFTISNFVHSDNYYLTTV